MSRRVLTLLVSLGLVGGLMAVSAGAVLAATCTTTCYVANSGNDTTGDGSSGAPFQTINKALSVVSAGGTVIVAAGTYPEFVNIGASVTLQGANSGVSCLGARGAESIITGTTAGAVSINADNVTVNGFQVSDGLNIGPIGTNAGIWMSATSSSVRVTNNLITNNILGIYANSDGVSVISCNSFVTNLAVPGAGVSGAHIYSEASQGLSIDRNDFGSLTGADANNPVIFGAAAANAHNDLTFSNNTVHDTDFGILVIGVNTGAFTGNDINTNGATAITFDGNDNSISVTGNNLHDNARGVRVRDAGYALGDNSDIHINNNALTGNVEDDGSLGPNYGIGNEGGYGDAVLDGECNWWGSADGPGPVGPGSGDKVTTLVDFTPWRVTSDLTGACLDVSITKTHVGNFRQLWFGKYTITVTNTGSVPTTGQVTVHDSVPFHLFGLHISGPGWTCDQQTETCWRSDSLAAGASYPPITLKVFVLFFAPTLVTNVATVEFDGDEVPGNNSASDPTTIVRWLGFDLPFPIPGGPLPLPIPLPF